MARFEQGTVGELIAELSRVNPSARVYVCVETEHLISKHRINDADFCARDGFEIVVSQAHEVDHAPPGVREWLLDEESA